MSENEGDGMTQAEYWAGYRDIENEVATAIETFYAYRG
jgi:hypothetical protein